MSTFWDNIDAGKIQLIAELGNAHRGNLDKAISLVDQCLTAGADVVKFQSRLLPDDVPESRRDEVRKWAGPGSVRETYLEYRQSCELSWGQLTSLTRLFPGRIGVSLFAKRFAQHDGLPGLNGFAFLKAPSSVPLIGAAVTGRWITSTGGISWNDFVAGDQHLYLVCASRYPSHQTHVLDAECYSAQGHAVGLSLHPPTGIDWEQYARHTVGPTGWRPLAVEVHVGPQVGTDSKCTHVPHKVFPALRSVLGSHAVVNYKTNHQRSLGL